MTPDPGRGRFLRSAWSVDAAGLFCAALYLGLALLARGPGEPGVAPFFLLSTAIAIVTFALYGVWRRGSGEFPVSRLLLWAVVFRGIGLLGGPFFEDDFFRYLWDGFRFAEAGTPYGVPPEAFFADASIPPRFQEILGRINFPELPTIYGPGLQWTFLAGYRLAPGNVLALQALFVVFDLLTVLALLRLAPPRAVLLYAWCPLVVKEVAFTAHPDGLAVFFVLAALLLARSRRLHAAAACLAFATGAKVLALVAVPFLLRSARPVHWATFAGALGILYLPFVWPGGADLATLFVFAREWEFNASVFALLGAFLPDGVSRAVCGGLFLAGAAWLWFRARGGASGTFPGDRIYGLLLLLSPVVNPWYLLWLLPFAAMRPTAWAWTASVAVLLSYATGLNLEDFDMHPFGHPWWIPPLQYGAIAVAAALSRLAPPAAPSEIRCTGD